VDVVPTGWSMRNSTQHNRRRLRGLLVVVGLATSLAGAQGCAKRLPAQEPGAGKAESPLPQAPTVGQKEPLIPQAGQPPAPLGPVQGGRQVGARISTYYLSAGDEIRISVFGYPDLDKKVRIPPDGHIFYPMVGDISVDGMSIPELRELIAAGLRSADEQRIGAGDQVGIRVFRNDDLTLQTTVPSSGRINLPLAGEMEIVGLTVEGANQAIATKLAPYVVKPSVSTTIMKSASGVPGRIADPHVSVEVSGFGGHKVLVLGEVHRPGVYVNEGGGRLLEIVARAGGPTKDAQMKNVGLLRPATETSPPRRAIVNLDRAIKTGDLAQNPPVQRGDIVYVPKTTIANVAQFFEHVYTIVRPLVAIESGIWLGENIEAGPRGQVPGTVVVQ
jgi:protein involved in polysaccharide export with SLBB domain